MSDNAPARKFVKVDDSTLSIVKEGLTRTFNFAADELTTTTPQGTTVQKFGELGPQGEVEVMRYNLKNMGGNPPPGPYAGANNGGWH